METLSGTDALFVAMETPSWHQHVGGLTIIEPGPKGLSYDDIVAIVVDRIRYAPKFAWRLQELPFARPVWVDDPDFDAREHVSRVRVAAPGGAKEVAALVGELGSTQLDRSKPLWELTVIEGLAEGRVGLYMKYHHSLIDGVAGAALATALLDIEPEPSGSLMPLPTEEEARAGGVELTTILAHEAKRLAAGPLNTAKFALGLGKVATHVVSSAVQGKASWSGLTPPKNSLNGSVGPRRSLAFVSIAMDDLKAIKKAHDVTVNDVVLAICGKALADHLIATGEDPKRSLSALMPASKRAAGDDSQDNQMIASVVALATDIEDPAERLQAIHASTSGAKELRGRMDSFDIPPLGEVFNQAVLGVTAQALHAAKVLGYQPFGSNTVISNVIGPPLQVYLGGGKVTGIYPCSVIMETTATNFTVISNLERMDFGLHADADVVPDPWAIVDRIPGIVAELMQASGLGAPTPVRDPFAAKEADQKAPTKKLPAKKVAAKKAPAKKATAKKAAATKATAKKATAKKATAKKAAGA